MYRLLFVLYIVRNIESSGSWKTHCVCSGLWMRNISEMLVQREGCVKKEVGYNGIEYGVAMEDFSDKTINPSGSEGNFLSSWINLHFYSFHFFLSFSILAPIILFWAASLTDLCPKSWNNVVVSSSRDGVSKKKNKKWKSWTLRRLYTRPLRYLARSDTINCSVQNLCHKKVWFRVDLRLSQFIQMHGAPLLEWTQNAACVSVLVSDIFST